MRKKELKYIGRENDYSNKYWMTDKKNMLKRAFESIFGHLKKDPEDRRVDKKRVSPLHLEILRKFGYIKNLPNLGVCILTDKAFTDKEKVLCTKN